MQKRANRCRKYVLALIFGHDLVLDHGVKITQKLVVSNEQMSLAAKVVEHAGHFNGNVACSHKSHLLRPLLQVEETIGSNAQFAPWSFRDVWVAAGSQQNLFSTNFFFAAVVQDNLGFVL